MTTYGETYERLMAEAQIELGQAAHVSNNGDLWEASIHLRRVSTLVDQADDLLKAVSKAAFGRVMDSRDGSR